MSNNQTQTESTTTTRKTYDSWSDVYMEFMEILDRILESTPDHDEARELIAGEVDQLYAQHEGDPLWDSAYERWIEPADDDMEVK